MIIDTEQLIQASYIGGGEGEVELELDEKVADKELLTGEIIFMCVFCDDIVIVIGEVVSYEELDPNPDLTEQDVWSRLKIKGRKLSFTAN